MKWTLTDVNTYNQSKEYIDTAVVPLIPVSLESDFKNVVSKGEFITYVTDELERQLKGRVFLFPSFSYIANKHELLDNILEWKQEIQKQFKHVIFLTSDETFKNFTDERLKDQVVWVPVVPFEDMDDNLMKKLLQNQIEQILNILLQYWNK